jgi:hypothetical protein
MLAALALMRTGASEKGRLLVQQVVAVVASHPGNGSVWDLAWWDVIAYASLGDNDRAIAALEKGVAAGTVLDIDELDLGPLLKGLRADSRYEKTVAPARKRAAAQVAAAQAAGLL